LAHYKEFPMFRMSLLVAAASLLVAFRASAADFSYAGEPPQLAPVAPTRMVCDDDGNCYRTRTQRYVERWHDDDDEVDGGEYRDDRPSYIAPGPGFYRDYDDDE
jgi:hypothetical protein